MIAPASRLSFRDRRIGGRVSLTELGGNGGNAFANSLDRTVEVCRARFDDDGLNCERWRESLRLEAALGVVSEDHLFGERAVSFADVERRVP
jgi:hypothetical protein